MKDRWELVEQSLRHLTDREDSLFSWQNLDLDFSKLDSKATQIYLGQLASENFEQFKSEIANLKNVYIELVYDDTKEAFFACVYRKSTGTTSCTYGLGIKIEGIPRAVISAKLVAPARPTIKSISGRISGILRRN